MYTGVLPARFIFAHVEEINDEPRQASLLLASPPSPIGKPLREPVSYLIHMCGPYARDRVADSEHGPRVPVPTYK